MKFFVATALVATLAVASSQQVNCNGRKMGVFANPTDCTRYTMCVAGAPVAIKCPGKMRFDSRLGTCSPFAKCHVQAPVVEEPTVEEPIHHEEPVHEEPIHHEEPVHEEPIVHEEPAIEEPHHEEPAIEEPAAPAKFSCPRAAGRFADAEDCKKYFVCKDGEAAHFQCPFKLNYSAKLGMCLPGVKCTVKAPEVPVEEPVHEEPKHEEPEIEEPKHEEPEIEEPKHEEPEIEEPKHEEPEAPAAFSCPRSNGRFRDPENCQRYYSCKNGEAVHFQCKGKMNFSSKIGMCLPGVKCSVKVPEVPVEEPVDEEPKHEEPVHEEPAHEEPKHEEPVHEEPAHEEPKHEEPVHEEPAIEEPAETHAVCARSNGKFADVHNCRQFFQCQDGQAELKRCPLNFRFSRYLGMCLPGIQCVEEAKPAVEEPVHEEPIHHEEPVHEEPKHEEPVHEEPAHEEPKHEEPVHEEPAHEEPKHEEPEEPAVPAKFACKKSFGLFADANDCGSYHLCVRGRSFKIACPTDSKYDFINRHCVKATQARCMKPTVEDVKFEEAEPVQEEKKFECPVDFGFYPASAAGKFIQCAHGTAHEMACPAGTVWNQEAQACDHA